VVTGHRCLNVDCSVFDFSACSQILRCPSAFCAAAMWTAQDVYQVFVDNRLLSAHPRQASGIVYIVVFSVRICDKLVAVSKQDGVV